MSSPAHSGAMGIWYESVGDVRGPCGHKHRTAKAAGRCTTEDQRGVRRAYPSTYPTQAYSDRVVRRSDGVMMTLTEDEEWIMEDEDRRREHAATSIRYFPPYRDEKK